MPHLDSRLLASGYQCVSGASISLKVLGEDPSLCLPSWQSLSFLGLRMNYSNPLFVFVVMRYSPYVFVHQSYWIKDLSHKHILILTLLHQERPYFQIKSHNCVPGGHESGPGGPYLTFDCCDPALCLLIADSFISFFFSKKFF